MDFISLFDYVRYLTSVNCSLLILPNYGLFIILIRIQSNRQRILKQFAGEKILVRFFEQVKKVKAEQREFFDGGRDVFVCAVHNEKSRNVRGS